MRGTEYICSAELLSRGPSPRRKTIAFCLTPNNDTEGERVNWKLAREVKMKCNNLVTNLKIMKAVILELIER